MEHSIFDMSFNEENQTKGMSNEIYTIDLTLDQSRHEEEDHSTMSKKRSFEEMDQECNTDMVFGVFLRSSYPIDTTMSKNITPGIYEALDYQPGVLFNHDDKKVLFTKDNWRELHDRIDFVENNILANKNGKKTRIVIRNSDIEIDNLKIYGKQYIRIRNGNKQSDKVLLTKNEFAMLRAVMLPVTRYLEQLAMDETGLKDKILKYTEKYMSGTLSTFDNVDGTIANRVPQEVSAYFEVKKVLSYTDAKC